MHPIRRKRLYIICALLVVFAAIVGLVLVALQQNVNLFYSPTQIQQGEAPLERRIRAGGVVVKGSVKRSMQDLAVSFSITDYQHTLKVQYQGILPDLFREGQGVVVQGKLDGQGELVAEQVLAKHDENYMPPEVEKTLQEQ
ncbi:cytochrome c maturation protein CcmE [Marinomonas epiphytica]